MVKRVHLPSHKLEDHVVLDAIKAVNHLKEKKKIKGRIAGGMAVQSYIPEGLHRSTIDLDFSLLWNGRTSDFKKVVEPLLDYLEGEGYETNFQKKGFSYDVVFSKGTPKDSFMIQHPRYSKKHFDKIKKTLEREVENTRIISREDTGYSVVSPEDSVVTKLNRILVFSERYDGLWTPSEVSVDSLKKQSEDLKKEVTSRFLGITPEEIAELRLVNDCYDVKCMASHVGLNKGYFKEVLKDWKSSDLGTKDFYGLLDKLGVPLE